MDILKSCLVFLSNGQMHYRTNDVFQLEFFARSIKLHEGIRELNRNQSQSKKKGVICESKTFACILMRFIRSSH